MRLRILRIFSSSAIALILIIPVVANAIKIEYELQNLGGNKYRYIYNVINDGSLGSGVPIKLFDILFETSLYNAITIATPNYLKSNWDEQILSSLPGIAISYDALSNAGGIPVGSSIKGFAIEFNWLGSGIPGTQQFEIYDSNNFMLLEQGVTESSSIEPASIPTLSQIGLIILTLALWLVSMRYFQSRQSNFLN